MPGESETVDVTGIVNSNESPKEEPSRKETDSRKDTANQDASEWQKKYAGLQTSYNKMHSQYQMALEENKNLQATLEEATAKLEIHSKTIETLQADKKTWETDFTKIKSDLGTAQLKTERYRVLVEKYPDLLSFENQGLLPVVDDASKIDEAFGKFQAALKAANTSVNTKRAEGNLPPPPGNTTVAGEGARTKKVVFDELNVLSQVGRRTPEQELKYRQLQEEWDKFYIEEGK